MSALLRVFGIGLSRLCKTARKSTRPVSLTGWCTSVPHVCFIFLRTFVFMSLSEYLPLSSFVSGVLGSGVFISVGLRCGGAGFRLVLPRRSWTEYFSPLAWGFTGGVGLRCCWAGFRGMPLYGLR